MIDPAEFPNLRQRLIGTWRLVDYIERATNGSPGPPERPFGNNPMGTLIYTPEGHVSVQLMRNDRPRFASGYWLEGTPDEFFEEATGYLAYAGRFYVDENSETVTHTITVALFPNWVGASQERRVMCNRDALNQITTEYTSPTNDHLVAELLWVRA